MDQSYPAEECELKDLPLKIHRNLVMALSSNCAWQQITDYLKTKGCFQLEHLFSITQSQKPAESLLMELGVRCCDVAGLCDILKACQLYSALLIFKPVELVVITLQPRGNGDDNSLMINRGGTLNLTCEGKGLPPPTLQWHLDGEELPGLNQSQLSIDNFDLENEGDYYCLLTQEGSESISSDVVAVRLAPEHPVILQQPLARLVCRLGSTASISVRVHGHPQPSCQWFKGCQQLDGHNRPDFFINNVNVFDEGDYRCYIHSEAGEVWSDTCRLVTFASPEDVNEHQPRPVASAKVALVIANQDYQNMSNLRTPIEDARTLAEILIQHGFQVIALQNLSLVEMRNAIKELCKILPKNSYVVFYFAGHGFEIKDKCMLPVCAPGPGLYMMKDAVSEGELLRHVLDTQPQVFLELLDMCLKSPELENKAIFEEVSTLHKYSANNNLIQGYSTTSYLSSYERKTERNGLYVKLLKTYLVLDIPMVTVLANVARDMEKECVKQMPYRGTNVTKSFRLSDPCLGSEVVAQRVSELCKVPQIQVMQLEKSGLESLVTCVPYLGVFCNALQVIFTNLQGYMVTCDVMQPELQLALERQGKDLVITVVNLQRIRCSTDLCLKLQSHVDNSFDYSRWCLGKPMIAVADLWLDDTLTADALATQYFQKKILQELNLKKQLLKSGTAQTLNPSALNAPIGMPSSTPAPADQLSSVTRSALHNANSMSFGYFVPQESSFGNNILAVLPRFPEQK